MADVPAAFWHMDPHAVAWSPAALPQGAPVPLMLERWELNLLRTLRIWQLWRHRARGRPLMRVMPDGVLQGTAAEREAAVAAAVLLTGLQPSAAPPAPMWVQSLHCVSRTAMASTSTKAWLSGPRLVQYTWEPEREKTLAAKLGASLWLDGVADGTALLGFDSASHVVLLLTRERESSTHKMHAGAGAEEERRRDRRRQSAVELEPLGDEYDWTMPKQPDNRVAALAALCPGLYDKAVVEPMVTIEADMCAAHPALLPRTHHPMQCTSVCGLARGSSWKPLAHPRHRPAATALPLPAAHSFPGSSPPPPT